MMRWGNKMIGLKCVQKIVSMSQNISLFHSQMLVLRSSDGNDNGGAYDVCATSHERQ